MAQSPADTDFDLENAPFSTQQRKWLEQPTQWARPPPSASSDMHSGDAYSTSTTASGAALSEGKWPSVHTNYSR